jgi:hypothetical protein
MGNLDTGSGGTALTPRCCRIYAELADQYKVLDPASAVAKRHVLAEHLREVIDLLELKVGCVGVGVTAYIPYQLRWGVGVSWRRGRPGLFLLTFDR